MTRRNILIVNDRIFIKYGINIIQLRDQPTLLSKIKNMCIHSARANGNDASTSLKIFSNILLLYE